MHHSNKTFKKESDEREIMVTTKVNEKQTRECSKCRVFSMKSNKS